MLTLLDMLLTFACVFSFYGTRSPGPSVPRVLIDKSFSPPDPPWEGGGHSEVFSVVTIRCSRVQSMCILFFAVACEREAVAHKVLKFRQRHSLPLSRVKRRLSALLQYSFNMEFS